MTFQANIASDVQKLQFGNFVTLFELDLSDIGSNQILYFTEAIDDDFTPIIFNAREYTPIHLDSDGWQTTGQETLPRPKIRVSNVLLSFTAHIYTFDDMIGAKLIRRRTLEKYLDGKPEANPNAEFAPDVYRIRQKTQMTKAAVEFELSPYMDFEGISIPKRQILRDFCTHTYRVWDTGTKTFNYTNVTCPYINPDYYYNRLGKYVTGQKDDKCGKQLRDCEMRFAGNRAVGGGGVTVYIEDNEPGGANGDYWLNTGATPNIWYVKQSGAWTQLKPQPLPTRAFPSVARFQI